MINKKHFIIDTASNSIYFGLKFVFNLVVFSILISSYSLTEYGEYIFFSTLIFQFEFIQSGFSTSLLRYLPLYSNDIEKKSNLVFCVTLVYLLLGILISTLLYALNYFKVFDSFEILNSDQYIPILILFTPFIFFFKTFSISLRASKDFRSDNLVNLIFLIIDFIIILFSTLNNLSITTIFLLIFTSNLVRHVTHFITYKYRHGFIFDFKIKDLNFEFNEIKRFSFWNFIISLSGTIINQFDKILVSIFLGVSMLPIYYGVNQFIKLYISVNGVFNSAIIPYFSEKINNVDNIIFRKIAIKGTDLTSFLGIIVAFFFMINSEYIFRIISKEYLIEYSNIFNICIIIYIFLSSRSFIYRLHITRDSQLKFFGIFGLISCLLYPLMFFILSDRFGIIGAIFSAPLTHLILSPFWFYKLLYSVQLSIIEFLKVVFNNIILLSLVFSPLLLLEFYFIDQKSLTVVILEAIFIIIGVYLIDINRKERSIVKLIFSLR